MKYLEYFEGRKRNWNKFYNTNKTSMTCSWENLKTLPDDLIETLVELNCRGNNLTSLPELPDKLKYLYCNNNELTTLPKLHDGLIELECFKNNLVKLPEIPNTLRTLDCRYNKLKELPKLPDNLVYLHCCGNDFIKPIKYEIYINVNDTLTGKYLDLFYTEEQINKFKSYDFQKDFIGNEPENFKDLKPFGYADGIKDIPEFEHLFSGDEMGLF